MGSEGGGEGFAREVQGHEVGLNGAGAEVGCWSPEV